MRMNDIDLRQGDCLELMRDIPDGSVDLVVTDPPYGTMDTDGGRKIGIRGWDKCIPTIPMFNELSRIIRPNGKCVLFSQEPYTSKLVTSAIPSLPFSYRAIWKKDSFGNCLGAKKNCVSYFEDMCIFTRDAPKSDFNHAHPLREYNKKVFDFIGLSQKEITKITGSTYNSHYWTDGVQFSRITKKDYDIFERLFDLMKMEGYLPYTQIEEIDTDYKKQYYAEMDAKYPYIFNLWQGAKSKSNVFEYSKDKQKFHPTQKPVALLEDLILTFSNHDNVVLDFTMGSGSTGVACVNTGRRFIGMELDPEYFKIAEKRILEAVAQTHILIEGDPHENH